MGLCSKGLSVLLQITFNAEGGNMVLSTGTVNAPVIAGSTKAITTKEDGMGMAILHYRTGICTMASVC